MLKLVRLGLLMLAPLIVYADNIFSFPLNNYSQDSDIWFNDKSSNYTRSLLSKDYQQQRLLELKHSYFGTDTYDQSPWSQGHFDYVINSQTQDKNIYNRLKAYLNDFNNAKNTNKVYSFNYQPYKEDWINKLYTNSNLEQFKSLSYSESNLAIAINNMPLRAIPTLDPVYYDRKIAGEGYPFDNNALSAVFVGTPLYVLGASQDKRWLLVMTPEYIGWVEAINIAYVDDDFINTYQKAAYDNLLGVSKTNLAISDNKTNQVEFTAYVGMIFPITKINDKNYTILIPKKDVNNHAVIAYATISKSDGLLIPLEFNQYNLAKIIDQLKGRPYGWGSMDYYTDCSFEMKSIYTLFGFFLPRNSKHQLEAGSVTDISDLNASERLQYIMKNANPMLTLIWIKGHIFMYVGTYRDKKGNQFVQTYQQMWGLAPADRSSRYVVGKSVFLPLLLSYPENKNLVSLIHADKMKLIYLNKMPDSPMKMGINELMY